MAIVIKIGKMWYSDFTQDGKRIRRALSPHKDKAEELLEDLLHIRKANKDGTQPKTISWFYFQEKYLTYSRTDKHPVTYDHDLRAFNRLALYGRPLLRLSQMIPEYLDDFRIKCKAKGLSERVVSDWIRRIKTAMHKAEDWGLIPPQRWKTVKCIPDRKRTIHLSLSDFEKVLSACHGPYHRAAMLMGWAGLRRGEVLNLEWSDIDFKNRLIKIQVKENWKPKGSTEDNLKERNIDMTQALESYLQNLPERTGYVLGSEGLTPHAFTRHFSRLGKRLGIRLFPHMFRHTYASFLISTRNSLDEVGDLLGHDDPRSTRIYTHMMPHARRNAVDRMEAGLKQMQADQASQ